jgi:hypothetical protein
MTAQIAEKLLYQGESFRMFSKPLSDYFAQGGFKPDFSVTCTALWRGYVGDWEILGNRLYLVALCGTLEDGREVSLETVFPGFPDRVFAHWYSGTLRVPQGKQLEYVHMGFGSVYERNLFLEIEQGVLVGTRVRHNGVAESGSTHEGYRTGSMTVFPRQQNNSGGGA